MKCYKIQLDKGTCQFTEKDIKNVIIGIEADLMDSGPGAIMTIETIEMSEEDYENLPEWIGP